MKKIPQHIIISRTDSIGDVVLTLPVAKVLKDYFPGIQIAFLGKSYTRPVIEACSFVDTFIDLNDFNHGNTLVSGHKADTILHVFPTSSIAKKAKELHIPLRIGTTNRLYHWFTCNRLIKLSRKNSLLHEAQLNLKLLAAFGIEQEFSLEAIGQSFGLTRLAPLQPEFASLLSKDRYNLILHTKSQGSAREWGLKNFIQLIRSLDLHRYRIFISGTEKERALIAPLFEAVGEMVVDITGKMPLSQFISFINQSDGLVANSTGPLHIAAALGRDAFGIYPPMRPIHPGRWAPLGASAEVFVLNKECNDCRKAPEGCHCMSEISPALIKAALDQKAGAKENLKY